MDRNQKVAGYQVLYLDAEKSFSDEIKQIEMKQSYLFSIEIFSL